MISLTSKIALGVCSIAVPSVQHQSTQDGDIGIDIRKAPTQTGFATEAETVRLKLGPKLGSPRDLQKPVSDSNERRLAEASRSIEAAVALAAKLP